MKYSPMWIAVVLAVLPRLATADESPIIPPDVVVEVVSTGGYYFTEGPALAPDGSIYFSDIPQNSIHRYDPETGETTLFTDDSGGANGLMFSGSKLISCAGKRRAIEYTHPQTILNGEGHNETIKDKEQIGEFEGVPFNSPNDLVVHSAGFGGIFFTDPRYGNRDNMQMEIEGVYSVSHTCRFCVISCGHSKEEQGFVVTRVIDDLVRPNGIGISPDEQTLYVNDNGDKKIWAYPILEPNKLGEARLLNDLADLGGPDGMTVGPMGNIYTTIYGEGVLILSPEGERLGFLETGPQTTNCVFGADGKTLYVTAEKSLKRVVLNTGVE